MVGVVETLVRVLLVCLESVSAALAINSNKDKQERNG